MVTPSRGYFAVAVYQPKTPANVGTLWRTASTYGAAFLATVGRRYERQPSDTSKSVLHTPLHHYADMMDLRTHLPFSCPLIGVELSDDAIPLPHFTHPPRALYLLGAEDHGLPPAVLRTCHAVIQIPCPRTQPLNVAVAGSIVIVDRYLRDASVQRAGRCPACNGLGAAEGTLDQYQPPRCKRCNGRGKLKPFDPGVDEWTSPTGQVHNPRA